MSAFSKTMYSFLRIPTKRFFISHHPLLAYVAVLAAPCWLLLIGCGKPKPTLPLEQFSEERMVNRGEDAVNEILEGLEKGDPSWPLNAVQYLKSEYRKKFVENGGVEKTMNVLRDSLTTRNSREAAAACHALEQLAGIEGGDTCFLLLLEVLRQSSKMPKNDILMRDVSSAIVAYGGKAKKAIPIMLEILETHNETDPKPSDDDILSRYELPVDPIAEDYVAIALGKIGGAEAKQAMNQLLEDYGPIPRPELGVVSAMVELGMVDKLVKQIQEFQSNASEAIDLYRVTGRVHTKMAHLTRSVPASGKEKAYQRYLDEFLVDWFAEYPEDWEIVVDKEDEFSGRVFRDFEGNNKYLNESAQKTDDIANLTLSFKRWVFGEIRNRRLRAFAWDYEKGLARVFAGLQAFGGEDERLVFVNINGLRFPDDYVQATCAKWLSSKLTTEKYVKTFFRYFEVQEEYDMDAVNFYIGRITDLGEKAAPAVGAALESKLRDAGMPENVEWIHKIFGLQILEDIGGAGQLEILTKYAKDKSGYIETRGTFGLEIERNFSDLADNAIAQIKKRTTK